MRDFLNAEIFYIRKDPIFRFITTLLTILGIGLAIFLGSFEDFYLPYLIYPLGLLKSLSILLFFIFPIYFCFFSTEGFESGSIKNIIASKLGKLEYLIGKYLVIAGINFSWWFLFLFSFAFTYYVGYTFKSEMAWVSIFGGREAVLLDWGIILFYLISASFLLAMFGFVLRSLSNVAIVSFLILFGDFIFNGYFKDVSNKVLQMIATHTISANIMKVSGNYLINGEIYKVSSYGIIMAPSLMIIVISYFVALKSFVNSDIK